MASGGLRPLLPSVCSSQNFVLASSAQVQEYATSSSVVAQLLESLDAWLSHCDQIFANTKSFFDGLDAECNAVRVHDTLICDVAESLRRLELETSFFAHFDSDEVLAVRRVLDCVPAQSKEKLAVLDTRLAELASQNKRLARAKELFHILDSYCARTSPWTLMNCDDTLPPLFCALRAIFVCCPFFGKDHPERFSVLVRGVLSRVEVLIATTVPPLLLPSAVSMRNGVEDAMAACLAAQAACVSIQEEFFRLRISISEALPKEFAASLYRGIDEDTVFAQCEFYYDRCVILLHLLSVIKQRKEELFLTESSVEKLLSLDLLSRACAHEDVIDAIRGLSDAPSMRPRDIVARMEKKAIEHNDMRQKREHERIMQVTPSPGSQQQQQQQQQQQRGSRIADLNDQSTREWSLQYGAQQSTFVARPAYYSLVVGFNPPRVLLAGIPLSNKQLELVSTRFQDAIRQRVQHTAQSIRVNKLDMPAIAAKSAILKAPYAKFRSSAEELADARYDAAERTFHKGPSQLKETGAAGSGVSMEAELMQLRRFHVAASHNAYSLDVEEVFVEDDHLQSNAVNALLETLEQFDGVDAEMATANGFMGDDGVFWNFFVFRFLPSLPQSRRKRSD